MRYLNEIPILGIIRGAETNVALGACKSAIEAGLKTLEITLNVPDAFEQIYKIKMEFGSEIELGAGTVLDLDSAKKAISKGAEFIVSPALIPEVIEFCRDNSIPFFPGAFSPTEIFSAHKAGAEMVKIFPASSLGPGYIRSLKTPLPDIKLIPTGGVTLESVPEYFRAGASAIGVGGEIFKKEWLERKEFNSIRETAKAYINAWRKTK